MHRLLVVGLIALSTLLGGCASVPRHDNVALTNQVIETEKAFAKTMADRDVHGFSTYVADDAVFFSDRSATRGKESIVRQWTVYFDGKTAPFSWTPDHVEVLDSGTLALSAGPVLNAEGQVIARFNSIWRRESSGQWKVVFDKGCEVCKACQQ